VARVIPRIDTGCLHPFANNQADSLSRQALCGNPMMTVNLPEYRAFDDPGGDCPMKLTA
jgi:hypothetical protein